MKVLDLQCATGHVFEGWFASEADFIAQLQKSLVQCPVCGDPSVVKKLSAPRLSLSGSRSGPAEPPDSAVAIESNTAHPAAFTDALLALARQVVAQTTDVGERFAEEARQMHYGEKEQRGIRGTATVEETRSLADEGIEVLTIPLPIALKGQLQ
ncbi:MAG: DUF1178 family protein [Pseudomonadota bacterium]